MCRNPVGFLGLSGFFGFKFFNFRLFVYMCVWV